MSYSAADALLDPKKLLNNRACSKTRLLQVKEGVELALQVRAAPVTPPNRLRSMEFCGVQTACRKTPKTTAQRLFRNAPKPPPFHGVLRRSNSLPQNSENNRAAVVP
jgi:hypothetical protein